MYAEPSWMRLGFSKPPDQKSGQSVGIIIIDDISPHPALAHLNNHLKKVVVKDDLSTTCQEIANKDFDHETLHRGIHGLMTVLTLAHKPFIENGLYYTGIAPGGNFIILSHGAFRDGEGDRLKRGVDWILQHMQEFNIRVILSMGWHAQDDSVLLKPTRYNSTVQSLTSAVEQGILVVCANGNSDIDTIMPPVDYFAVGGFNDHGKYDRAQRSAYHGEPFGLNGDGHFRPDIRAPRTRIPIPYCENVSSENRFSYYAGTSGASALVAGVCMHLISRCPSLSNQTIKNALICFAEQLHGDANSAKCINVKRTVESLMSGYKNDKNMVNRNTNTTGTIEHTIKFSRKIRENEYTRDELWERSNASDPLIRKIAVYALGTPINQREREEYWNKLSKEPEDGISAWYLHGLLQNTTKEEAKRWIPLAVNPHWSIRWCVAEYLSRYQEFPQLEKTDDPELVTTHADPVLKWFKNK